MSERSRIEKDLLKLDEKANILYSLQQGQMLAFFPLPEDVVVSGIHQVMI